MLTMRRQNYSMCSTDYCRIIQTNFRAQYYYYPEHYMTLRSAKIEPDLVWCKLMLKHLLLCIRHCWMCHGSFAFFVINVHGENDVILFFESGIFIGNMHSECSQTLRLLSPRLPSPPLLGWYEREKSTPNCKKDLQLKHHSFFF